MTLSKPDGHEKVIGALNGEVKMNIAKLIILTWYGVKNYRETGKHRETDLMIAGIRAHPALKKRKYQEPRPAGQQPSSGRADK
jgi:hypothetical protein